MLTAAIDSLKRRWFANPATIEALKKRDRKALVSALAEPDHEREFGTVADELLTNEAQRDQHRARAQQLPEVKKQFAAVQQKITDEWQAEQARRNEYDRAAAVRLDERANLERLQGKLEMSARWLLQNIDPTTQSQLDALGTERTHLSEAVAVHAEVERQARSAVGSCERQLEAAERDIAKHPHSENYQAELGRWQRAVTRSTAQADAALAALDGKKAELAAVVLEIDTILADVKAGKR
jgi:hypothetical protein